jgi:hypothetical protein
MAGSVAVGRAVTTAGNPGRLGRGLSCGARIGSRGLGAGDGWGTLGLVARDRANGRAVAITAMHVTGFARYPPGPEVRFEAMDVAGTVPVRVGRLLMGTVDEVDAAKISIDPPARVTPFLPGVGPLRRTRALTPDDLKRPVHLYGARSGYTSGVITDPRMAHPPGGLKQAFTVSMACGGGDSGAVCCDAEGAVLGLYVGTLADFPSLQVFSPIRAVLDALGCDL